MIIRQKDKKTKLMFENYFSCGNLKFINHCKKKLNLFIMMTKLNDTRKI